jgi:transcriptional regulator with PAS, ATPase and Fis domain
MERGGDTSFLPPAARSPQAVEVEAGEALIGSSPLFRRIVAVADAVSSNDCVVLLEGESGTGKEVLARRIHRRSRRAVSPFIPLNCAGISESLFESQLFGHVRGAFTGATNETLGVVRAADGGTLLLDEVSEIPTHLQPKLLRLLQEREVVPVGSSRPETVDVRFIAATNRNLRASVEEGRFRADLFHRLNIVRIEIPPLRVRRRDVDELLDHFLDVYAAEYQMARREIGATLRGQLREYAWPGNVRELAGWVERLYAADIPPVPPGTRGFDDGLRREEPPIEAAPGRIREIEDRPLTYTLAEAEQAAIVRALNETGWNRTAAARLLAIHRSTLLRKMRLYGLGGLS